MPAVDAPIRNVRFDSSEPVSRWSAEVVEIVLDRGSLSDWRLIAAEIQRQPWGSVARQVAEIVSWSEHYGVDEIMAAVIARARDRFDAAARQRYASRLRERRLATGITQHELAEAAGTSASRLSAYESGSVAPTTTVLGRIEAILDSWQPLESPEKRPAVEC